MCPALDRNGDDDRVVAYADSAALSAKLVPHAVLKTYEGAPHGRRSTESPALRRASRERSSDVTTLASHVVACALGIAIVAAAWQSIIVTIILPRRSRNWVALVGWIATYRFGTALARLARDPDRKDELLSLLAPINIVGLLFTWMAMFAVGFGFVMWSIGAADLANSFDLAGSSIFTLGFATGKTALSHALMDAAAASGMIVVGLQIGYLPTIYGAYSQRETLVTLLTMRAAEGGALTGATVLRNHPLPRSAELLRTLYASWEASAAAIVESHTNYPWLIAFRSPRRSESWITSMLAILDSVALLEALAPSALPLEAEHGRFACTATLDVLSRLLVPEPRRRAARPPLLFEEFVTTYAGLETALPIECDAATAWTRFRAARAAYEGAALKLALFVELPTTSNDWLRPVGVEPADAHGSPQANAS